MNVRELNNIDQVQRYRGRCLFGVHSGVGLDPEKKIMTISQVPNDSESGEKIRSFGIKL
jgi:hypothetical protein